VSAEEVVRLALDRIDKLNPALNAVIALRAPRLRSANFRRSRSLSPSTQKVDLMSYR